MDRNRIAKQLVETVEAEREGGLNNHAPDLALAYAWLAGRKSSQRLFWHWLGQLETLLAEENLWEMFRHKVYDGLDPFALGWQDAQERLAERIDGFVATLRGQYEPGDQIAYVPQHANGDLDHQDVEFGFVTSVREDTVFCRYFRSRDSNELRTLSCSEGANVHNIVPVWHHEPDVVKRWLWRLGYMQLEEQGYE